jgi:small subunit ribosomal protein S4
MHGAKRKKKSDYGAQLEEQQKLKAIYGMLSQKQLVRYYQEAEKDKANTPNKFICRLECRLDTIVYRLKLATTIFQAQQMVSHGHIHVNGKKVDRRSFEVKPGMIVSVKPATQKAIMVEQSLANPREVPTYLSLDASTFSGQLLVNPEIDQVPFALPVNVPLICEFLAHNS